MNETIDKFLPLERDLFFALNGSESTFWDNVMWAFTGRFVWIPIIVFILFSLFYKTSWKQALLILLMLVVVGALCDQISSSFLKPFFQRFRPTHHPDYQHLVDIVNDYRGGQFGFVSGHATNSFGIASFLSLVYQRKWLITNVLFFWAIVNSYSRIYLGVHFISDIIAGALLGMAIGYLMYKTYRLMQEKVFKLPSKQSVYTTRQSHILALTIFSYILCITAFSKFFATLPH